MEWAFEINEDVTPCVVWTRLPKLSIDARSKQWCTIYIYIYTCSCTPPQKHRNPNRTEYSLLCRTIHTHLSMCNGTPPNSIRNIYPKSYKLADPLYMHVNLPCHDLCCPASSVASIYIYIDRFEMPAGSTTIFIYISSQITFFMNSQNSRRKTNFLSFRI